MNNMEKTQRQLSVDIESAKNWYKSNNETLKQLALSVFTEEELTKVEVPTSWEEFCNKYPNINNEWYINPISHIDMFKKGDRISYEDKNLLETKEDAEGILALIQLKRLRDDWWKALDWKPDYADASCKYTIIVDRNAIHISTTITYQRVLVFPTKEIAEDFIICFRDLINKAKRLI